MYDDDMMGLAFGEGMLDAEVIKDHVMAAAAGGAAAFAAGYGISKLPLPQGWDPLMRTRVKLGIGAVAGIGVARVVYDRNPEAAMAITGAVTGLSLLGLVMTFVKPEDAMTLPGLSAAEEADEMDDADDEALLSMYDDDTGMMSDLATPGVTVAPPAFAGLADPTVTPEALFGLEGTIVQEETLGGYNAYMS